jgi:hypothetical protein
MPRDLTWRTGGCRDAQGAHPGEPRPARAREGESLDCHAPRSGRLPTRQAVAEDGRASPFGRAGDRCCPAGARVVLAGRTFRVPVASVLHDPHGQQRSTGRHADLRHRQSIPAMRSAGTRLPSSGPLGPHRGHDRPDRSGQHRSPPARHFPGHRPDWDQHRRSPRPGPGSLTHRSRNTRARSLAWGRSGCSSAWWSSASCSWRRVKTTREMDAAPSCGTRPPTRPTGRWLAAGHFCWRRGGWTWLLFGAAITETSVGWDGGVSGVRYGTDSPTGGVDGSPNATLQADGSLILDDH